MPPRHSFRDGTWFAKQFGERSEEFVGLATEHLERLTAPTARLTRLWHPPRTVVAWLATVDHKKLLRTAPDSGEVGGLFHGRAEWAAIVNRKGQLCAVVQPSDSAGGYWPGSRTIAMAKAYTANGFSTDTLAFSTARLYTLTQPGHSLWGVSQPEPLNPQCLDPANDVKVCGGAIAFGGGVPLYKNRHIAGGLGISGDTPCADHEIAKRIRHLAGLDPAGGPVADDIQYSKADRPSIYTHPLCPNTWRNGQHIGDELPAAGY